MPFSCSLGKIILIVPKEIPVLSKISFCELSNPSDPVPDYPYTTINLFYFIRDATIFF